MAVKDFVRRDGNGVFVNFGATGIYRRSSVLALRMIGGELVNKIELRDFMVSAEGAEGVGDVRLWAIYCDSVFVEAFATSDLQAEAFRKIISVATPFHKLGLTGIWRVFWGGLRSALPVAAGVVGGVVLTMAALAMLGAGQVKPGASGVYGSPDPVMPSPVSPFMAMGPTGSTSPSVSAGDRIAPESIDVKKIPLDRTILVGTKGKPKVFVFSDPRCDYCVRFENEVMPGLAKDYEVRVVPVPVQGPDSATLIAQAFCAKDPGAGWSRTVKGENVELGTLDKGALTECVQKSIQNYNLSKELGVMGTPTVISATGRTLGGFAPLSEVKTFLSLVE